MPFLAECPLCDTEVRFTVKPAGEARCPQCQTVMVVNDEAVPEKEWVVEHAAEQPVASPVRRRRWLVAVGGILLAAGAAFGIYQWTKPRPDPRLALLDSGEWPQVKSAKEGDPERTSTLHIEAPDELSAAWLAEPAERLPREGLTWTRKGLRSTWLFTTAEDARTFAARIDFATVARVDGRVVTALGHVAPNHPGPGADRIAKALFLLSLPDRFHRLDVADLLRGESPADPRREDVARRMTAVLEDHHGFLMPEEVALLNVWVTPRELARAAKNAHGFINDDIVGLLLERLDEPDVRAALVSLGDPQKIEWDVLRRLKNSDDRIVIGACQILREVGTEFFSGKDLQNVANTAKSPAVQAAAKDAIAAITSREKEKAPR